MFYYLVRESTFRCRARCLPQRFVCVIWWPIHIKVYIYIYIYIHIYIYIYIVTCSTSPRFLMSHKCTKWILLTRWGPDKRMADFFETTYLDLKINQIMRWPKKWQAIAWTNGHLEKCVTWPQWVNSLKPGDTHICQWIRQLVTYFTREVNPVLTKLPLILNGCLAKRGLTSLLK